MVDILGSIDTAWRRSGIKVLDNFYNLLGYDAKILIAPVYCTQTSVTAELAAYADKLKAIAYVDAPIGNTFAQAIAGGDHLEPVVQRLHQRRAFLFPERQTRLRRTAKSVTCDSVHLNLSGHYHLRIDDDLTDVLHWELTHLMTEPSKKLLSNVQSNRKIAFSKKNCSKQDL
ncbi:hypothetical protein ArsFIN_42530 (plasmid) [Arsenophonus nasoniae]|uniref:Uncharacterized protein n=1 Tax=Arsenophonus nasoniae TaxID=638 RepID=A0A4P7L967_9GAMM|nr:hypothetical protein ArsFIN_42530 [Arsenophonus nasoniae]